ncbi:MAG TPA: polysaccharide deacetylase family protein [Gemmatimonadales bacterium]|nr:polysaccharide deacetylase family protein [Gemmatimonadales bacterium]
MIGTAAAVSAVGAAGVALYGALEPNNSLFGPVTGRGPRDRRVYLTFDDGPNPEATPRILGTLADQHAPAAFFMVGAHVRRFPEIARAVAAAGQTIGNHTDTHAKLHLRGPAWIARELGRAHDAIVATTGAVPRVFRAPHGYRNPFVLRAAHRRDYRVLGWTFGVWDSARPGAEEIRRRVRARVRPGAILLLHDGDGYDPLGDRSQTAGALPGIIADLRAAGYELRPIAELFAA